MPSTKTPSNAQHSHQQALRGIYQARWGVPDRSILGAVAPQIRGARRNKGLSENRFGLLLQPENG